MDKAQTSESVQVRNILLVEDDPGSIRLTEMAVKNSKFDVQLQVAVDGGQAMVVLRDSKQKALPDLILLDITLPGANGWEILRAIKNDSKLASIPVVVLTASIDERYVQKCYDLQADGFINKPLDVEKLTEILFGGEGFTLSLKPLKPGELPSDIWY